MKFKLMCAAVGLAVSSGAVQTYAGEVPVETCLANLREGLALAVRATERNDELMSDKTVSDFFYGPVSNAFGGPKTVTYRFKFHGIAHFGQEHFEINQYAVGRVELSSDCKLDGSTLHVGLDYEQIETPLVRP